MTATTRWWWVRHAPVTGHDGRLYGRRDVAADLSDAATLARLAARLPRSAVWVASPLLRTRATGAALAEHVAANGGTAPRSLIEPDFIEQDFGAWQGLTYEEIDAQLGPERSPFWFAPARVTPPGGESFATVVERVEPAVARITQAFANQDIVAMAHAGTVRAALALALGLDPEAALRFSIDTLSLTRIDHITDDGGEETWRVVRVNDRSHLETDG